MKIKDLTGAALDWAVAKCEGREPFINTPYDGCSYTDGGRGFVRRYSTVWEEGGPIIERERISIRQWTNVPIVHAYMPQDNAPWQSDGTSPLIAAMRCYVASKLGDEVDVPEELI